MIIVISEALVVGIISSIIAHYICKWLDRNI